MVDPRWGTCGCGHFVGDHDRLGCRYAGCRCDLAHGEKIMRLMGLYLISRHEPTGDEPVEAKLVRAASEDHARQVAAEGGLDSMFPCALDPERTACVRVHEPGDAGVILTGRS